MFVFFILSLEISKILKYNPTKIQACNSVVSVWCNMSFLIFVKFMVLYINQLVSFLISTVLNIAFRDLLYFNICYGFCSLLKPMRCQIVVNFYVCLVPGGDLPHWQLRQIFLSNICIVLSCQYVGWWSPLDKSIWW